jgi:hypothetical protein
MRLADPATVAYLQSRKGVKPRDFLWITGKNRSSGLPESVGFWSDWHTVTVPVISGETGLETTRTYTGSGTLIRIDAIPLVSDLTIRTVRVKLSQLNEAVALAIRGYDPRFAKVEIHRGMLDLDTNSMVAPALPHFVGRVNQAPIDTPAAGAEGSITLSVVSHSRELTKTNPQKRSDETQRLRSGDRGRRWSGVAGQWDFFWGVHNKKAITTP